MIRLIAYAFVALFTSLFVSTSDVYAHANHNHGIEKSVVHNDVEPSHNAEHRVLGGEQSHDHSNCPFSCCEIACAACCVLSNTVEQVSENDLNTSIQKFLLIQQRLNTNITYSDSPPPRS